MIDINAIRSHTTLILNDSYGALRYRTHIPKQRFLRSASLSHTTTPILNDRTPTSPNSDRINPQQAIKSQEYVLENSGNHCQWRGCCSCDDEQLHKSKNQYLNPECLYCGRY